MTIDDELSAWVAGTSPSTLPDATRDRARLLLLDAIASAYAGRGTPMVGAVTALARGQLGEGTTPVIGGGRLSPAGAAFVNGFQVTAATVCDVHRPTLTHVTPEVVPAALAAAWDADIGGADLLAAIAVGSEITVRVAQALDTDTYRERRFHNPGIAGAIGAAVAVARVHCLGADGVRDAIAHGASQAGGTFAALGSSGVKVHQARGALSGLLAGGLAVAGVDGAAQPVTADPGGLLAAYAGGGNPRALTDRLGSAWAIDGISLRRWPAASSLQPVIAATLEALRAITRGHGRVRGARVSLPPRGFALNGGAGWGSQLEALQSARWIVAVVVADGECWVPQTAPERLSDPEVAAFASSAVHVHEDASLPEGAARVRLSRDDGRVFEHEVRVSPGDPGSPLAWGDVVKKLGRSLEGAEGPAVAGRLANAVQRVEERPARELIDMLVTAPSGLDRKDLQNP